MKRLEALLAAVAVYLKQIPIDTTGAPYELDLETHEVKLSANSNLGVLPMR